MQPSQAEKWITEARFAPYVAETGGDHDGAVALYVWNARISAAMFETLHHVEVFLRNAVDSRFPPVDACAAPRETWLEDPAILNDASRRRVHETIARISREGKAPTRGRVVAGLSFGFWRALFDKKYDGLWVSRLHGAFPAGSGDRAEVAALMSKLVPFRNRLAHHETIMGRPIDTHYEEMLTLVGLIDPAARVWTEQISRVPEVLDTRPS
ncbi:MAG TPA: hypothetical protein VMF55_07690 [Solirubrobacterales bacterium]|nr:hypothetical protein [Solirubrobacterales bacterium]